MLMLMIIFALVVYGLCLGSFVNALVWRIHSQESLSKNNKQRTKLSIATGRSMCPNCKHVLAASDLLPVFSWLWLRGKCRYCHKPISVQYPLVELLTMLLFVVSYLFWPRQLAGLEIGAFICWLGLIVGFMALVVYDLRWMLLPNRIIYPLTGIAAFQTVFTVLGSDQPVHALINTLIAVTLGGGIFYVLFQMSDGKWIGGGDVRLGWLLGLSVASPGGAVLFIFIASLLGSISSLPLIFKGKLGRNKVIPFGPFLIVGAIITQLFGQALLQWYQHSLLGL